jgi:hypothetical protein
MSFTSTNTEAKCIRLIDILKYNDNNITPSPFSASHDITIHQELDAIEEWL